MSRDSEGLLVGKTALVTGAGKRLGRAIAWRPAQAGADLVLHHRSSASEAEGLAADIRKLGRQAWLAQADLEDLGQAESLFDSACRSAGGGVDILVNSAAIFPQGPLMDLRAEDLDRNVHINAWAPFALGRALARSRRGGCIVNLLDSRMTDYDAQHCAYQLSKRMLLSLTRMMALEFAPRVRVNAVAPGLILPPPGEDEGYLERLKRTNPLEAFGGSADVAEAVLFLARSGFVTGQVLFVDGGRHMRGAVYG